MLCRNLYLEAPYRTQDLLTVKWTLLGVGHTIGSKWHDDPAAGNPAFAPHWRGAQLAEMQQCDGLVVVASQTSQSSASLAAMAGIALAKGMKVVWIGSPVEILKDSAIEHFASVADFEKQADRVFDPSWHLPVAA